jgi:hypothetical protein
MTTKTTKKPAALSPSLVAVKGKATVSSDAKGRQPSAAESSPNDRPLNFKVDAEFRRRFRQHAASHDMKLSDLLRDALDAWEEKHGLK